MTPYVTILRIAENNQSHWKGLVEAQSWQGGEGVSAQVALLSGGELQSNKNVIY